MFLQSDAAATIIFTVCFSVTTISPPIFEGNVYFIGKPADSSDDRSRYMLAIQLGLIEVGSSSAASQSCCQLWKRVLEHEQP